MANSKYLAKLDEGVRAWNRWRRREPNVMPDLSNADLKGLNLSNARLSAVDLSGADLSGANLGSARLSGTNLSKANLGKVNLSNADLGAFCITPRNVAIQIETGETQY